MYLSTHNVRYRGDIQGLRAIAVLSVVVYHASAGVCVRGGFVGVDVFFVISGFLITQILLKENEQERFSLVGFYQRRIRRLYPALLTVLSFTLVMGAVLLAPKAYRELAMTSAASMLFASNISFLSLDGYFEGGTQYKPLVHTWSLAVEEQFYIFFPILLYLIRHLSRRAISSVLAWVGVVSLGLSMWMSNFYPISAFYLAPPRVFEFLIGSLMACHTDLLRLQSQKLCDALSLLGLGLIIASILLINDSMVFPGAIVLAPCCGAALVIAAGQVKPSLGGRLISSTPFVFFGNISYSLYLWHWPLLALGRNWVLGALGPAMEAEIALGSILLAYMSWRWIEVPFIRGLPSIRVFTTGLAASSIMCTICIVLFAMKGLPNRFSLQSQVLFAASDDYNHRRPDCHSDAGKPIPYDRNCTFGAPRVPPSMAVWADSHGAELVVAIGEHAAAANDAVMEITSSACPPVLGYTNRHYRYCARHNIDTAQRLAADRRIKRIVMLADFSAYQEAKTAEFEKGFESSVSTLTRAGKEVTIFDPIPTFSYDAPMALGLTVSRGKDPTDWGMTEVRYRTENESIIAMIGRVAKATGATVIPTADLICQHNFCPAYAAADGVLYFNANHLSISGARRLAAALPFKGGTPGVPK